ncbi:hypothetical protein AMECASPLE_018597 [Ameca splendens]|uniref:Uncharacterized protein n=1 Tax=Ameca splendens TaxID=208324 RepID=A0ABV0YQD3_9TELE
MHPVTPPLIHKHRQPSSLLLTPLRPHFGLHTSLNPSRETTESGICPFNHVSVKHKRLHSRYSLWSCVSAASSSVFLEMERTFPIITEGRHSLYLRFLQPLCSLCVSSIPLQESLA